MIYGSVCSGIEAATVAWHPLGWKPSFFSEIDKFPRQVLSHHYPDVPLHGDFTTIQDGMYEPISLLVGGTPCQSFSVAGLRAGLDDPRGNLMLEFGALAKRLGPKWLVWENVPGVLSANKGRDFGTFLGMLGELGYGFAYRVLDAQYFGVAQRRRRVFVVGCFGDWRSAAAVLFERESMSGDSAPSRKKGETIAPTVTVGPPFSRTGNQRVECDAIVATQSFTASSFGQYQPGVGTIRANGGDLGGGSETLIAEKWTADVASTLNASFGSKLGLENQHINSGAPLFVPACTPLAFTGRGDGGDVTENLTPTMRSLSQGADGHQSGSAGLSVLYPQVVHGTQDPCVSDIAFAQGRNHGGESVLFQSIGCFKGGQGDKAGGIGWSEHVSPTLSSADGGNRTPTLMQSMAVRRLTPTECERLQGFPDGYTKINDKTPDGPRYKALGNSMAVPCMRWIGERINMVEQMQANNLSEAA